MTPHPAAALLALLIASPGPTRNERAGDPLRVGLLHDLASATSVEIACAAGLDIDIDGAPVKDGPAHGFWRVTRTASGVVVRSSDGERAGEGGRLRAAPSIAAAPITVRRTGRGKPRRYRGEIEVTASQASARLAVVNLVDLGDYLRGVVPAEMGSDAPGEALRAQAVCARTYALRLRASGKHLSKGRDLDDTTMCQAYLGVDAETAATDAAIRDTAGLALLLDGALTWADYSADCGGATAPGATPDDYPPSVSDRDADGNDLCAASPYHLWAIDVSADDLTRKLASSPARGAGIVEAIQVVAKDVSGRVTTVRVSGQSGDVEISGVSLRAALGYEQLRSTRFTVTRSGSGPFVFKGRGNGHGRGMCQCGAMALARGPDGLDYRRILAHYFPGATVGPVPPGAPDRPLPSRSRKVGRRSRLSADR